MTTYIVGLGRAKCSEIASVRVRNVGIRVRFQMNERSTVHILSFSLRPNKLPLIFFLLLAACGNSSDK